MANGPDEISLSALANTRAEEPGNRARGWRTQLESLRGRRATIFAYMFSMHIYYPLKNNYERKYVATTLGTRVKVHGAQSSRWHWRAFPRMWPLLVWYRVLNSAYLVYMILRTLYPPLLEAPLQRLMGAFGGTTTRPAHCYLLGRLEPNYARRASACLFALYHLAWRYYQVYDPAPNYTLGTIYFLLFDDRDILHYYQLRTTRASQKTSTATDDFFHEIMSLRADGAGRWPAARRLRPNRTPAASRALRKQLVDSTIFWLFAVFMPLASSITLLLVLFVYRTSRYLAEHPGCSPELERAFVNHPNASPSWLDMQLRWHQILSLAVDTLENGIIWSENGLATVLAIPVMMVIHYDLILYWRCVNARLKRVLAESRQEVSSPAEQSDWRHLYGGHGVDELSDDDAIYELQLEWQDFIKQIEHADAFIGEVMTMYIVNWLTLFAVFTFETLSMKARSMPLGPSLTLLFIVTLLTCYYARLLVLHRLCLRSYTKICSLMAHNRSVHRLHFMQIMDYFLRNRTCFTLCRHPKMTAATYLKIVGWSFSCYFILVNVNNAGTH